MYSLRVARSPGPNISLFCLRIRFQWTRVNEIKNGEYSMIDVGNS
jgi:hypothetical protein